MIKQHSPETKNKIKASLKATREKRETQHCKVYELKINSKKLNSTQKEQLKRAFLEAKWLKNTILASENIFSFNPSVKKAHVKMPDGTIEERDLQHLGAHLKQSILSGIKGDIKALKESKNKGRKVGKLKFTKAVKSLDLKEYGNTYTIDRKTNTVKIQKLGHFKVYGLKNIPENVDFANAKLLNKPDGYYLKITTYTDKKPARHYFEGSMIGIDMGLKTSITTSEGDKLDLYVEETDRLKGLQRKLKRQKKGSNNYKKTLNAINRIYQKLGNKKEDLANKLVSDLSHYEIVFFQDENISEWKRRSGYVRGGKKIQHGVLGRVKKKLRSKDYAVMIGKSVPTTQQCVCGAKNKHQLDERVYFCSHCGHTQDRDIHAAQMMVHFGLNDGRYCLPVGSGSTPVEHEASGLHFNVLKGNLSFSVQKQENFNVRTR